MEKCRLEFRVFVKNVCVCVFVCVYCRNYSIYRKVTLIIVITLLQAHSYVYIHVNITNLRKFTGIEGLPKRLALVPPTSGSGSESVLGVKTNCTLF